MFADFPEPTATARPVWLTTLADLGLILVGFFVFLQSTQNLDRVQLAEGIRNGFGLAHRDVPSDPMPVSAAAMTDFATGSAVLPSSPASVIAWAREAARDPRVELRVAGSVDGSAADVDPASGSGAVLAADRARAVAAVLARANLVARDRITIVNTPDRQPGRRQVVVTMGFAGGRQ